MGVDIENTQVIFDAYQTFRGILEPLSVYYFGDVQANPARRRLINAVVQRRQKKTGRREQQGPSALGNKYDGPFSVFQCPLQRFPLAFSPL